MSAESAAAGAVIFYGTKGRGNVNLALTAALVSAVLTAAIMRCDDEDFTPAVTAAGAVLINSVPECGGGEIVPAAAALGGAAAAGVQIPTLGWRGRELPPATATLAAAATSLVMITMLGCDGEDSLPAAAAAKA